MVRILSRSVLPLMLLAAVTAPAFAQPAQTGTISGAVTDATGGALPGVTAAGSLTSDGGTMDMGCARPASVNRPSGQTSIKSSTNGSVTNIGFAMSPNANAAATPR